jgi:hypothetical protein
MGKALLQDYLYWYERYIHVFHLGGHLEGRVAKLALQMIITQNIMPITIHFQHWLFKKNIHLTFYKTTGVTW